MIGFGKVRYDLNKKMKQGIKRYCHNRSYEIRQGKNLSFRALSRKISHIKSLGIYYAEENVRLRLEKIRYKTKTLKPLFREARLYINISTYITTGNRECFERWAKLNNLKEAAKTFNYLSENNLLNYEDFQQHISNVENSIKAADQHIQKINTELTTQKVIQKHCDSYQLHDSLKKELQDFGITKIPSSEKIQKRIDNLVSEKTSTIREKQKLRKKQLTLDIIQQNFSALLNTQNIALSHPLPEETL